MSLKHISQDGAVLEVVYAHENIGSCVGCAFDAVYHDRRRSSVEIPGFGY